MIFTDIKINTNLNIIVKQKSEELQFHSKVVSVLNDKVLIDAIRMDGKAVKLSSSPNIRIDIMACPAGEAPYMFTNVLVKMTRHNGRLAYQVTALKRGKKVNRRAAERIFLGVKGNIQLGINKSNFDVVVKDISQTGFSFAASRNLIDAVDMPVKLRFKDDYDMIDVVGRIVRKTVLDDKKVIYGCQLLINKDSYQRYVLNKEKVYTEKMKASKNGYFSPAKRNLMRALKER